MNNAVQSLQAPLEQAHPGFRPSTEERLISRVLFEMPDGTVHQTSISSTLALDLQPGSAEASERIKQYTAIYTSIGARILRMEFVNQIGLELGC